MNKPEHTYSGYFSFLSYLGIGFAMCTITGFATHPGLIKTENCEQEQVQQAYSPVNTIDRLDYLFQ
ncbi:MAG TPA: hypothetical protein DHW64_08125 [Chitinophagaceae bacterium]|jgi:hypothetical protein|nr:hypothetical protein [Chitinophagaceae bacterium]